MSDCLFCKILAGDIPSSQIWEDDDYYAFLDLFPNCYGQAIVIPKKHHDSQIFEMGDSEYSALFLASKHVSKLLKKSLKVERIGMILEGMGVNHAHIKLYPMHGLHDTWEQAESVSTEYHEEFPGYLTTKMGEMLSPEKLESIQKHIRNNKNV